MPDLPGCIATGEIVAKLELELSEAIRFHIEGLKEDGLPIPPPSAVAEYRGLSEGTLRKLKLASRSRQLQNYSTNWLSLR